MMKTLQKSFILWLCLMFLYANSTTIADTIPDNEALNYRTSEFGGMLAITGYAGKETMLTFPSELNGKKVIQIGNGNNDRAFSYNNFIEITIPDGVKYIADYTFSDCKTLKTIEIPASVEQIAPPETLFAGAEYHYIIIKTPRGSFADAYALKHGIPLQYTATTITSSQTPTPALAVKTSILVPVYYLDEYSAIIAQETRTLEQTSVVSADTSLIPEGYSLLDGAAVLATITDSSVDPNPIVFSLKKLLTPTPSPTPSPTPLVLHQPENLQVTNQTQGEIELAWNTVDHAEQYEIAYKTSGTAYWTVYKTVDSTAVKVTDLAAGTSYDFRVTAISGAIRSDKAEIPRIKTLEAISTPTKKSTPSPLRQVKISKETFPDNSFRKYISERFDTDHNGILSKEELQRVTIIVSLPDACSDLTGIEYFTELTVLRCSRKNLKQLDLSKNTALVELDCYRNQLTQLNLSNNSALKQLNCSGNKLTQLDVSKNTALVELICYWNQLTQLDVSNNTVLECLICSRNQLKSVDISACPRIKKHLSTGNRVLNDFSCWWDNGVKFLEIDKSAKLIQ